MSKKQIFVDNITKSQTVNVSIDTIKKNKQAIVFVSSKASAEKQATDIFFHCKSDFYTDEELIFFNDLSQKILNALPNPTTQCKKLSKVITKGIAFHHSGLTSKQRELIEDAFRSNKIKIISSTPTLAAGLDLPAFRTILNSLKRFSSFGMSYIPVMEYKQMAGRAGRPGKEDYGEAIIIANKESQKDEIEEIFINGVVEKIQSKLAVEPVLRTYLLSLISTGIVKTQKSIFEFFDKTFWAHQFNDTKYLHSIITRMLNLLLEYNFIKIKNQKNEDNVDISDKTDGLEKKNTNKISDFESALNLIDKSKLNVKNSNVIYTPTRLGQRVSQLYLDPYTANFIIENLIKIETRKLKNELDEFAFIQMISATLEMRPYLRVKNKEWNFIQEKVLQLQNNMILPEPDLYDDEYDEYFDKFKTSLMILDWINEKQEQELMNVYSVRPGEIKVKTDNAYWLIYASIEISKIIGKSKIIPDLTKIGIRIKNGVKDELIDLLKVKGIGRVRARRLFNNGITNTIKLKNTDPEMIKEIVGKKIGENITGVKSKEDQRKISTVMKNKLKSKKEQNADLTQFFQS